MNSERPVRCYASPYFAEISNQGLVSRAPHDIGVQSIRNLNLHEGVPSEHGVRIKVVSYSLKLFFQLCGHFGMWVVSS